MNRRMRRLAALLAVLALVLAACGGGDSGGTEAPDETPTEPPGTEAPGGDTTQAPATDAPETTEAGPEPVTIEWWHLQHQDPMLSVWQEIADAYVAENPHVTIDINFQENEALKTALELRLQADDPPDIFQSWGGGGLAAQAEAGLVQDITAASAGFTDQLGEGALKLFQVDGAQYAIPYNMGMVGFWYNTDLFAQAGIEEPPTTWEDFLTTVQLLQDAGITPIAVGAGDKWPAHFYYSYLLLRLGGQAKFEEAAATGNFNFPEYIEAGNQLKELIDLEPFQEGFLAATWPNEGATIGNGQAAMDLMGQWAPGAFENESASGEGITDTLGWFTFPAVTGGAGDANDALGGGDGFAVGRDAPPEAVDFLGYLTNVDNAIKAAETGSILPVTKGAEGGVTDPHQLAVVEGMGRANYVQLYLDQYFSPELGGVINDNVQFFFAGEITSEELAQAITDGAGG